ncbi:MAG TPA: DUF222 domain-containing protein [Marmoricola sp.]|nr:DUF222 domain-containing protein [Marmoricola sp.]
MTALADTPVLHPLQPVAACLEAVGEALESAPPGPLPQGDAETLAMLVTEATRVERMLRELRLRLARAAEASRVADSDASSGTDAWLAKLTGSNAAVMRGGLWLARMLQERYPAVREAFAAGDLGEAHARIIVRSAEEMPSVVTDEERDTAVAALVEACVSRRMNTKSLRRKARRMLDAVKKAYADQQESDMVKDEEKRAAAETWLNLQDNGDGTWSGRFVIPDAQARMLLTHLQHLSSPRRMSRNQAGEPVVDQTIADATGNHMGLSWTETMGQALVELCEHLPTDGLAQHGRVGATIAIHLDHQRLLDGLAAARLDSGGEMSVGEVRRLACGAGIIPVVYGGASQPLDVGRESRLHTKAQRLVLSGRYDTCAAEGCQRPFAWCEIHHPHAWAEGGATDMANALPLCGWHHRRAHDERYDLRHLPSGEVRYRRRT